MNESVTPQLDERVQDRDKAELMAYACAPYLPFEINAREAGLTEVASDIAERREQAATAVAEQYDTEQQWMRTKLLNATEKAMAYVEKFKHQERPNKLNEMPVTAFRIDNAVGVELLDRLHALFGCQEAAEQATWEEATVGDRKNGKTGERMIEVIVDTPQASFHEATTSISTSQRVLVRELPTSLGVNLKEIKTINTDKPTIFVCLGASYEFREEEVVWEEEHIMKELNEARNDTFMLTQKQKKQLLEKYGGLEGDELDSAIRAAAELSCWERYKQHDWIELTPRSQTTG